MSATPPKDSSPGTSKPYYSKRPHNKTRRGCSNCKRRRVKCSEDRPSCTACLNRREQCNYTQAMPVRNHQLQAYPQPSPPPPFIGPPPPPTSPLVIQEFRHLPPALAWTVSQLSQVSQLSKDSQSSQIEFLFEIGPWQKLSECQKEMKLQGILNFKERWEMGVLWWQCNYAHSRLLPVSTSKYTPEQRTELWQRRSEAMASMIGGLFRTGTQVTSPRILPPELDPDFGIVDQMTKDYLLQHFMDHTSTAFNVDPIDRRVSDRILSGIAFKLSFSSTSLMNAILAITALHIKCMGIARPELINEISSSYSRIALAQYLADIELADNATIPHLLVTSLLMAAISSERFRDRQECSQMPPQLTLVRWMRVWVGIGIMIQRITIPGLIKSGLSELFYRPPLKKPGAEGFVPMSLFAMAFHIPEGDVDFQYREVYKDTVRCMGVLYQHLKDGLSPVMRLRIITWFTFVSPVFVSLAEMHNKRALVFLAYYAIFMKLTTRVWWMENVGQRSLEELVPVLVADFPGQLEVPIAAMRTDDANELGRLLLADNTWHAEPLDRVFTPEEMMYDSVRDNVVNDLGRTTLRAFPHLVFDENVPGGVTPALWIDQGPIYSAGIARNKPAP